MYLDKKHFIAKQEKKWIFVAPQLRIAARQKRFGQNVDNNGYACCSFGASRLSATPRRWLWRLWAKSNATNPVGEGSSRAKHALFAENAQSTELPTDF